jgi:sulfatase modifying factor 1
MKMTRNQSKIGPGVFRISHERFWVMFLVGLVIGGILIWKVLGFTKSKPQPLAGPVTVIAESALPGGSSAFTATIPNAASPPTSAPEGMVWIPGGVFSMGSTVESESMCGLPGVTQDALPVHRVHVDGFWMDATELTNRDFAKFVKATGYMTIAERTPTREEFPDVEPKDLVPGAIVFTATTQPVSLNNHLQWWRYTRKGPTGVILKAQQVRLTIANNIRWSRSPMTMLSLMRSGRARACPLKLNGSSRRAAG